MDSAILLGLVAIAVAIYYGMDRIARAIEYRNVNVNLTGPIRFEVENNK